MARARAAEIENPMGGIEKVVGATAEGISGVVKTTVKATATVVYSTFYYASFGTSYVALAVFGLLMIGNNPIGRGIKDGAVAAGSQIQPKKRSRR